MEDNGEAKVSSLSQIGATAQERYENCHKTYGIGCTLLYKGADGRPFPDNGIVVADTRWQKFSSHGICAEGERAHWPQTNKKRKREPKDLVWFCELCKGSVSGVEEDWFLWKKSNKKKYWFCPRHAEEGEHLQADYERSLTYGD